MNALVSTAAPFEMVDTLWYYWHLMQSSDTEGSRHLSVCLSNYIMSHWYLPGLNLLGVLELSNEVSDIDGHI